MQFRIGLVAVLALTAVACGSDSDPEPELGTGQVFIQEVEVVERGGDQYAVVTGWYPDACSTYGGSKQEVDGTTIRLTVTSNRERDVVCAQVLTDMTEEILVDVDDLEAGEYSLIANESAEATLTVE